MVGIFTFQVELGLAKHIIRFNQTFISLSWSKTRIFLGQIQTNQTP